YDSMARLKGQQGAVDEARRLYVAAVELQQGLAAELPAVTAYRSELARHHIHLGDLLRARDPTAAAAAYQSGAAVQRRLAQDFPWRWNYHGDLGLLLLKWARLQPPTPERVRGLEEALQELEVALGESPGHAVYLAARREARALLVQARSRTG